jgi:hypothetical protein
MPGIFQTGCASIDLAEPPFSVTRTVKLFLLREESGFGLYKDEACTLPFDPPDLEVYVAQSTGLYFYIVGSEANAGVVFCNGTGSGSDDLPPPVLWRNAPHSCPQSVTYGKIRADRKAFSMKDFWQDELDSRHPFDLQVEVPGRGRTTIRAQASVSEIDPTIVQKGEEPPGGGG